MIIAIATTIVALGFLARKAITGAWLHPDCHPEDLRGDGEEDDNWREPSWF